MRRPSREIGEQCWALESLRPRHSGACGVPGGPQQWLVRCAGGNAKRLWVYGLRSVLRAVNDNRCSVVRVTPFSPGPPFAGTPDGRGMSGRFRCCGGPLEAATGLGFDSCGTSDYSGA